MGIIIDDDGVMHKVFTKDEVIAMFEKLEQGITKNHQMVVNDWDDGYNCGLGASIGKIQDKIDELKCDES